MLKTHSPGRVYRMSSTQIHQAQYSTGQPATATATATATVTVTATATATATAPPPLLAVAVAVGGGFGPWDSGRKTRFSNDLPYDRSKVSVKKS